MKQLLDTIDSLEKWNGHLYNWYDTKTLRVLPPAYVSTVDSGNLAGFLITLKQGLEKIKEESAVTPRILEGLRDTALLLAREGYEVNLSPLEGDNWKHGAAAVLAQLEEYKGRSAWMNPLAQQLKDLVEAQSREVSGEEILQLAQRAGALAEAMDFKPLYAENRGLFYIGYDVSEGKPSGSYYDLLASEARQASFVAIAKGDVPVRHWFRLGRALAVKDGYKGLASWSGTMFEYFMPRLLMKNIHNTLMDETYHFVMAAQWDYGKKRNVPWGVSEAALAAFDMKLNYQYKAFGIPELGFKRGLGEDTVIAPYASVLGLMSAPAAAVRNLRRIHELGGEGLYGFYESIDYTPGRQLRGKDYTVVKTYMVHHLGMSLLSLDNVLHSQVMQERFHSAPMVKGVEYLLQERVPVYAGIISGNRKTKPIRRQQGGFDICVREAGPTSSVPAVQLLSNSTFCSLIDQNGCGYMKSGSDMVTRFRRCDDGLYGMFVYLRNCGDGKIWSAAPEPMGKGIRFKTFFHSHKAEIIGENDGIAHIYETAVSPEDSLEVRRLRLKNNTGKPVTLEVTSYLEPVLGKLEDDIAHSAFGKLFISTEYSESHRALLARRGDVYKRQHQDMVRVHQGGDAVGNQDDGAAAGIILQRSADFRVGFSIHGGQGIVKNHDWRVLRQHTGDGDALLLAPGQGYAPFPDNGVVPLLKIHDCVVHRGDFCLAAHHLQIVHAKENINVLLNGFGKEERLL